MFKKALFSAVAGLVLAAPAFAQVLGTVSGITEIGQVVIVRGGTTYSLQNGDSLFEGDEIISRTGGSVQLEIPGCPTTLGSSTTVTMGANACAAQPQPLTPQAEQLAMSKVNETMTVTQTGGAASGGAGAAAGGAAAGGAAGSAFVVPALLTVAGVGGIAAAASDDDDDDNTPSSP